MAPFEALYGRRCRTPLSWSQTGERKVFGPELVVEAEEKVKVIQENLIVAESRQKSYFDKRRKPLKFNVGNHIYLRVSPTKDVQCFGIKGKLAPCYIGPYEIIEECGQMAYRLRLPLQLVAVYSIIHISQLKKCVRAPTKIIKQHEIFVELDLSCAEYPLRVLDQKERGIRRNVVKMYKIQWNHHTEE